MTEDELEEFIETIEPDEKHSSVSAWIEALQIFSKYFKEGAAKKYFCEIEHDGVHFYVDLDKLTPESEDGRRLIALGFMPSLDSENWLKYS